MTARWTWAGVTLVIIALLASVSLAALQLAKHKAGHVSVTPVDLPLRSANPGPATSPDLGAITALAPFGRAPANDAPTAQSPSRAPLNVTLQGVLRDADPARSRAFLRVDGVVDVFAIGDAVASAQLIRIDTDNVTLRRADNEVVVGFDGIAGGEPPTAASPDAGQPPEDPFARMAAAIVPGGGSIDLRDPPPPETTEQYIDLWRDRILRNPMDAMERVGVELVENGYRIKTDPNIGVTLAGLRPGDVITGLNGQSVGNLERDRIIYDDVAAAGIARVEVERDGRAILMTFPLR